MKRLLVTGASGFLGWNVCRIAPKEWDIYGTVFSHEMSIPGIKLAKVDLTDAMALKNVIPCPLRTWSAFAMDRE